MWICTNNAFLSIVNKDCGPDELLVRSRRPKDIRNVFPDADVRETIGNDYQFRAVLPKAVVGAKLADLAMAINYPNFKNSVGDKKLATAYGRVWHIMADLQPVPPYASPRQRGLPL
jgi:hypothetical protein